MKKGILPQLLPSAHVLRPGAGRRVRRTGVQDHSARARRAARGVSRPAPRTLWCAGTAPRRPACRCATAGSTMTGCPAIARSNGGHLSTLKCANTSKPAKVVGCASESGWTRSLTSTTRLPPSCGRQAWPGTEAAPSAQNLSRRARSVGRCPPIVPHLHQNRHRVRPEQAAQSQRSLCHDGVRSGSRRLRHEPPPSPLRHQCAPGRPLDRHRERSSRARSLGAERARPGHRCSTLCKLGSTALCKTCRGPRCLRGCQSLWA